ncbi:hypothetical protein [Pseudogemmobacter humi]|uniref:hypothetical protein n=1 Tax=Pseudogemmobacter humi TaxID=2483812 RepID=UPI0011CD5B63|nr:hypothetical protein [Pseudogemmobacter humi]
MALPQMIRRIVTGELPDGIAASFILIALVSFGAVMGLMLLFLLLVIPFGGIAIEYRLTENALIIEGRLLAHRQRRIIPLDGLRVHRSGQARLTVRSPDGTWIIFVFGGKNRQALRAALPEGAFL